MKIILNRSGCKDGYFGKIYVAFYYLFLGFLATKKVALEV